MKIINKLILLIFFLSLQLLHSQNVIFANSATGNDINDGQSPATAKKTFTSAFNAASANDIIDLTGTFTWTDAGEVTLTTSGFTINKNIEIRGQGADKTIIQANSAYNTADRRVFTITQNHSVTIKGVTIQNGRITSWTTSNYSAGIYNLNGILSLIETRLTNNVSNAYGGAITNYNGILDIDRCLLDNNLTNNYGGAAVTTFSISPSGTTYTKITNSIITANAAISNQSASSAGVYRHSGDITVTNSTIAFNDFVTTSTTVYAGLNATSANVKNTIIANNKRNGQFFSSVSSNNYFYDVNTIVDNGGNIIGRTPQTTLNNSTWFDKKGSSVASGIFTNQGDSNLTGELFLEDQLYLNNEITGVLSLGFSDPNSIAINNALPGLNNGVPQPTVDIRGAGRGVAFTIGAFEFNGQGLTATVPSQASNISIDEDDVALFSYSFTPGSAERRVVFIKQGQDLNPPILQNGTLYNAIDVFGQGDQIGNSGWYCIYNGGLSNNLSATSLNPATQYSIFVAEFDGWGFETGGLIYNSNASTNNPISFSTRTPVALYANSATGDDMTGDGSELNPYKTFSKVYLEAYSLDTIILTGIFTWTDTGETTAVGSGFTLDKHLTIRGQGANQTIIQANQNQNVADRRVFTIASGRNVTLEKVHIRYGKSNGTSFGITQGCGGIQNFGTNIINECRISHNNGGYWGGALGNNFYMKVLNSTIDYNTSQATGAGFVSTNSLTPSTNISIITNSTIAHNRAASSTNGNGGIGIRARYGDHYITNSTIAYNVVTSTSDQTGIGIKLRFNDARVFLKNTIVANNMYTTGGVDVLINTTTNAGINDLDHEAASSNGHLRFTSNGGNMVGKYNPASASDRLTASDWTDQIGTAATNNQPDNIYRNKGNTALTGPLDLASTLDLNNSLRTTQTFLLSSNSIANNAGNLNDNGIVEVPSFDQRGLPRNTSNVTSGSFEDPCLSINEIAPAGQGTINDPYLIANFNNLLWVSNNSSSWGSFFLQTADIDASVSSLCFANGWLPIGNMTTYFTGTYNGNGHTISNLFINRPTTDRIGLFGQANGAIIFELGLINPTVYGRNSVGALVGLTENGTEILSCFAREGLINGTENSVGGLVGNAFDQGDVLSNSYAVVKVEGGIGVDRRSAGLVGTNSATITNCYAAGEVRVNSIEIFPGFFQTLSHGFANQVMGNYSNNFFNTETSGHSVSGLGHNGLTTSQMQQQASFTNWDFQCEAANGIVNIWGIDEGNDYPRLSWEGYTQDCTVQWTGTVSSDWNNFGNWSNQLVPNTLSIPVISSGVNQPISASSIEIASLTINLGASFTINPTHTLKINGNITNNGQIIFKSDATGSGAFDAFLGTLTGSGTVQVERYIPARRAFRFVTPSVTTSGSIFENLQENGGTAPGLGTHITGTGAAVNGFDATTTNNPSMFTFTNGSWAPVTSTLGVLTAGTPYRLMVRGDRTTDLSTNTPTLTNTTLRATGNLFTGNFTPTLNQAAQGYSFIGNPYQAPLDMQAVLTASTHINSDVLYYWDPTINNRGGYVTRTLTTSPATNNVTSNFTEILQPGQAVFVKKENTASDAAMTISETHKAVTQGVAGVFRTSNTLSDVAMIRVNLQANVQNTWQTIEGALAIFNDDYSWAVTQEDATKMNNLDEEVSFMLDGTALAIALQNQASVTSTLPIQINKMRHTDYQWTFDLDNYSGLTPMLWDEQTQTMTAITNSTVVPFSTTATATDRFRIVFQETMHVDDFSFNIALYPNPGKPNQSFYLSGVTDAKVSMQSLLGQEIPITTHQNGQTMEVKPMTALSAGVYFVRIIQEGKSAQVKWIVE